jgi:hypothetical protein
MLLPCQRSRLVAWVSLVSYLLANTHAGSAMAPREHPPCHAEKPAEPAGPHHHEEGELECQDCDHHASHSTTSPTSACTDEEHTTPTPDARGRELRGTCPCCPKSPCDSSCPCPGGCAMCNVAKTPCVSTETPIPLPTDWLGDKVIEMSFSYVPPVPHGLIRPPRA